MIGKRKLANREETGCQVAKLLWHFVIGKRATQGTHTKEALRIPKPTSEASEAALRPQAYQ